MRRLALVLALATSATVAAGGQAATDSLFEKFFAAETPAWPAVDARVREARGPDQRHRDRGRLAIIDFEADRGSKLPEGVPANRGGHGVPPAVVLSELTAAGFTHVKTVERWPPGDKNPLFLVLFRKP